MADQIQPISNEDVMLWPDGTWCFRQYLGEHSHMSDDFEVLPVNSARWIDHLASEST